VSNAELLTSIVLAAAGQLSHFVLAVTIYRTSSMKRSPSSEDFCGCWTRTISFETLPRTTSAALPGGQQVCFSSCDEHWNQEKSEMKIRPIVVTTVLYVSEDVLLTPDYISKFNELAYKAIEIDDKPGVIVGETTFTEKKIVELKS
jgi:hypothetical protein